MYTLVAAEDFNSWLTTLKDSVTRARLLKRLRKVSAGNLGDHASIGDGIWELREFFGPGWRMYYIHRGNTIILLLGGGTKSTQQRDIEKAKHLATELQDEQISNKGPTV